MEQNFWEEYIAPARIFGNLYFVGTRPASTHLIDTGDGLIVIDAGFPEALPQVLENIRTIGFDPSDIKIILLSHGHYDHAGAALELSRITGAQIYLGAPDLKMVNGEEDSSLAELFDVKFTQLFTPDVLLGDRDRVALGNTDILCLLTPGHTDGTLSFFFDVTDGEKTYRAGMFGGAGTNTLTKEFLTSHGLPYSKRDEFLNSVRRLEDERVEIFLGNHVENNDTEGKLKRQAAGETDAFLAPSEWLEFLRSRRERLKKVMEGDRK
ncbi:MAG: MBL fold metallo-hydrolase [Ruminococcaceae bacterium]|nr:MBL fold metallo-hydrolase [Oscillospiraceae bacterium]